MCEALYSGDAELTKKALNILDWSLERGWDKENGGMFYFVDVDGRPCEQLEWDMKLWWVHNEILIASLAAYQITGEEKYWNWFEKVHDYAFSHFHDAEHGEWYGYLHRDGTGVTHPERVRCGRGRITCRGCLMTCDTLLGPHRGRCCADILYLNTKNGRLWPSVFLFAGEY